MKKKILLLTLPILLSCSSEVTSSSIFSSVFSSQSSIFNSSIINQSSFSSTSDDNEASNTSNSSSSFTDEIDGFFKLCDGLYINRLPGIYDSNFQLEFKITKSNRKLLYTFDNDLSNINNLEEYTLPLIIEPIYSNDKDDYPLTISVDAILANDYGGKCVSTSYINNIQNPGSYVFFPKQNVVSISFIDTISNISILNRSLSYIINKNGADAYTIPIVSLSLPYEDMFGNKGFYNKIREDIEKRVNIEYIDPTYNEYFYRNSQIKLGGNWSLGYPQRTLNLNFNKDENGNKNKSVNEHVFEERKKVGNQEETLDSLTRFRLHNGGNCFEERTGFNDAIIQKMMEGTNIATTACRPCLTYINGEYWGIYYIREHYKSNYFETNFGIEKENLVLYELKGIFNLEEGDPIVSQSLLSSLENYVYNNDFSKDEVYEKFINEYVDIDSFIDMFISESYAGNWDFVGNSNNLKMWRVSETNTTNPYADGKWRFAMHDVDFAFTDYETFLRKDHQNSYTKFPMFSALLKNKKFRMRFLRRTIDLMKSNLSATNASQVLNEMYNSVKQYKVAAARRWGQNQNYSKYWVSELNNTFAFFNNRQETFIYEVNNFLNQY